MVFVDLEGEQPEFYPVPGAWFREDVSRRYTEYLARVARVPAPAASHLVRWSDVFRG